MYKMPGPPNWGTRHLFVWQLAGIPSIRIFAWQPNVIPRQMKHYPLLFTLALGGAACEGHHSSTSRDTAKAHAPVAAVREITDTAQYIATGNPDTALALFLYKEAYAYNYDLHKDEYVRWYTERSKIRRVYNNMFAAHADYEHRLVAADNNSRVFLNAVRMRVFDDFKRNRALNDTLETAFLFRIRDKVFYELLNKIKDNPQKLKKHRELAHQLLNQW